MVGEPDHQLQRIPSRVPYRPHLLEGAIDREIDVPSGHGPACCHRLEADADTDTDDKTAVRQAIRELLGLVYLARLSVSAAVDLERRHPLDSPRHRGRVMRGMPQRQIL